MSVADDPSLPTSITQINPPGIPVPYTIFKDFIFAAAHHIPGHPGKCAHLHGHTYKVRAYLEASELDHLGMVIDFAHLKAWLKEVAGPWDHRVINDFPPFDEALKPTAELLASEVFNGLAERLAKQEPDGRVQLKRVEVWESDHSCAIYEP